MDSGNRDERVAGSKAIRNAPPLMAMVMEMVMAMVKVMVIDRVEEERPAKKKCRVWQKVRCDAERTLFCVFAPFFPRRQK